MKSTAVLMKWGVVVAVAFVAARLVLQFVDVARIHLPSGLMLETQRHAPRDLYTFPEKPWVLFVGGSTVREAIEHDELTWNVRKFAEPRGMASDIALALDWTLKKAEPDHLPELVVWGVHSIGFIDRKPHPALTKVAQDMWNEDIAQRLRFDESGVALSLQDRLLRRLHALDPWFRQRSVIRDGLEAWLRSLVYGDDGLFEGHPTCHVKDERKLHPIDFYINRSTELGLFVSDPVVPVHERAIEVILEILRERELPLIVVGMPEHSAMRVSYPATNRAAMFDRLRGPDVQVVDWIDLLPDKHLADHLHATDEGRVTFSRKLNALLDDALAGEGQ